MHSCLIFCSFDYRAFRWMMTMVFTVEEINRNSRLLPGVKLGYRIMDSCDHVYTSLQAIFSLVTHSKAMMIEGKEMKETENILSMPKDGGTRMKGVNTAEKTRNKRMLTTVKHSSAEGYLENKGNYIKENITEERIDMSTQPEVVPSCLAGSPVPAVIGLASSSPTRAIAHTLGSFSIPLVRKK